MVVSWQSPEEADVCPQPREPILHQSGQGVPTRSGVWGGNGVHPQQNCGQPGTGNAQNLPGHLQEHGQEPCGLSHGSCLFPKLKAELKFIKLS